MRKLIDIVKIIIGFGAGLYAVMQAINLSNASQAGGGASEQAYAVGGGVGSIIGLVLGAIICVTLLGSAFFGKRKKKAPQDDEPRGERTKRAE